MSLRNIDPLIYLVDGVIVVLALNQYLCMLLAIVLSVKAWKEKERPYNEKDTRFKQTRLQ